MINLDLKTLSRKIDSPFLEQDAPYKNIGKKIIFILLCLLTLFVYWEFASIDPHVIYPEHRPLYRYHATGYYTRLTDAFLNGQLSFLEKPHPSFLELKDPYDPAFNLQSPYRLQDASLYKGKWYAYFGVTPVFLLWLPAKAFGFSMTEPIAVTVFCWLGFLFSFGFVRNIAHFYKISLDNYHYALIILLLSFSTNIVVMIKRPFVYEVAISCAYFCLMSSLYFYSLFLLKNKNKIFLLKSGILLSFSIASRFSYVIFSLIFVAFNFFEEKDFRKRFKNICIFFIPILFIIFLQFLYNYLRFDSFLEFGNNFQVADILTKDAIKFEVFNFKKTVPIYMNRVFYLNKNYGLFELLMLYIFILSFLLIKFKYNFIKLPIILFIVSLIQFVFLCTFFPGGTNRYLVDFVPILILSIILLGLLNENKSKHKFLYKILSFIIMLTVCCFNLMAFPI
jgi:hypothetical protein